MWKLVIVQYQVSEGVLRYGIVQRFQTYRQLGIQYQSAVPEDHAYVNTELIKNPQKIWQSNILSLEHHKSRNLYSNTKSDMFT